MIFSGGKGEGRRKPERRRARGPAPIAEGARPGTSLPRGREGAPRPLRSGSASSRRGVNFEKQRSARRQQRIERFAAFRLRMRRVSRFAVLSLLLFGLSLGGGISAYRWYSKSPFLSLRSIEVTGNRQLERSRILALLGVELGAKLPSLAPDSLERALLRDGWIRKAEVERVWPQGLKVVLEEEAPLAMGRGRGWEGLDALGRRMPRLDPAKFDLPVVDGLATLDSAGRSALGKFLKLACERHPDLYGSLSQIRIMNGRDAEMVLRDGRLKVVMGLDPKAQKALSNLSDLLRQEGSGLGEGHTVDLRIEDYAYVR